MRAAAALLLALLAACGPSPAERKTLEEKAARRAEQLHEAERLRSAAVRVQEDAAHALAEAVRGELKAEDAFEAAMWRRRRDAREAEKQLADIGLSQARTREAEAADAYLTAERAFAAAAGEAHDRVLFERWRGRRTAPASTKGYETSGPPFAVGMLISGLGVALVLAGYLGYARRRQARRPPSIRVRRDPAAGIEIPLLAGRYRLKNCIGRGGFGRVWDGENAASGRRVAIKQMRADLGGNAEFARSLYLKEARTLAKLRHPGIVEFIESVERAGVLYLIFEYVEGKTLQQILAERKRLEWREARGIFADACAALAYAHGRGIVHRDLKPANIMLAGGAVKLMDFGISRALAESGSDAPAAESSGGVAHTRNLYGTPAYTCPEAARGIVSPAADMYSLGVCMYETLTGVLPFGREPRQAGTLHEPATIYAPGLPSGVERLLDRMLEPDYEKRLSSAAELARALEAV